MAIAAVLWPRLAQFARDHPDVVLDINTEGGSPPDLVAGRFDVAVPLPAAPRGFASEGGGR